MSDRPVNASGDGSRPATSGGVENIGAGESFTGKKSATGEDLAGPAPSEGMQAKRKNIESSRNDDAAPFSLKEDLSSETNRESVDNAPAPDALSREDAIRRAAYDAHQRRGGGAGSHKQDWLDAEAEFDRQAATRT
ncbi:DUF2934 domain-containing protein [Variovorax sp. J22G73]|uniref:DUF2934 domain-containing protein n=1 Tax=unclassified Variovorax TaxID=663243 RepID=UPI002576FF5E|nr:MULTISPECIES: DUF2934 domain-containing protein [unclassified Variovorax]MDM0009502.1 DUF2934 domain-containing protein [Variovorax sp. J22R203]MDM0102010.1 DUF2934 domain-containing protein [Variovorax sp. J22G73]